MVACVMLSKSSSVAVMVVFSALRGFSFRVSIVSRVCSHDFCRCVQCGLVCSHGSLSSVFRSSRTSWVSCDPLCGLILSCRVGLLCERVCTACAGMIHIVVAHLGVVVMSMLVSVGRFGFGNLLSCSALVSGSSAYPRLKSSRSVGVF